MVRPPPHRVLLAITTVVACAVAGWGQSTAPRNKIAFVTSVHGNGDFRTWPESGGLTGLEGGDAICQARAAAAGLASPQDFVAWLSNEDVDAYCHVHGLTGTIADNCGQLEMPKSAGPWVRTDGLPFMDRVDLALAPAHRVFTTGNVDEYGRGFETIVNYWTATGTSGQVVLPVGLYQSHACGDWTVAVDTDVGLGGSNRGTAGIWTSAVVAGCDNDQMHLLCLESGPGSALREIRPVGVLAFVTSVSGTADLSSWPDAGGADGVAAGDSICRARAAVAGLPLPQSFNALLSANGVDAVNRMIAGATWCRIDGVQVILGKGDLADGSIQNPINLTETGVYLPRQTGVWTGTYDEGIGTYGATCENWTSADDAIQGRVGEAPMNRVDWSQYRLWGCDETAHLYCLSDYSIGVFSDGFESGGALSWRRSEPDSVWVYSLTPVTGLAVGGEQLTIFGEGFSETDDVLVGSLPCVAWEVLDDVSIRCTTPPRPAGDADVSVVTGSGHGTLHDAYRSTIEREAWLFIEWGMIESPSSITTAVGTPTEAVLGIVQRRFDTPADGESPSMIAEVGYGPYQSHPGQSPGWVWFDTEWDSQYYGADRYTGTLVVSEPGTYSYAYRFSVDGGYSFHYVDLGPNGTKNEFRVEDLGVLTAN